MKILALAACSALMFMATPKQSQAQLGADHFRAWDRADGQSSRSTRRAGRRSARSSRGYRTREVRRARMVQRMRIAHRSVTQRRAARVSYYRSRTRIPPISSRPQTPISRVESMVTSMAARLLPHPPGCPRRAFCGCGAAIEVFGRPIRNLWLAANWLRFPSASPAAGMAAARRGHVMVIRKYLGNNKALVYDANSGGGRTRLHVRSLAGFRVVNPKAGRA